MNKEKQQGLIAGAITFVLVVMFFLFIGSETSATTVATSPEPTGHDNSGLLMAVTFTLTLLGLIALNHLRNQENPKGLLFSANENNSDPSDTSDLRYQLAQARRDLQNSQREHTNALNTIKQLEESILDLFGTTNFTEITREMEQFVDELSELRSQKEQFAASANLSKQLNRQQELTTRLANERNQATALLTAIRQALAVDESAKLIQVVGQLATQAQASREWQEKAEEAQKELATLASRVSLRHQHKEASQWKEVELVAFMETVNYGQDKLATNRWARRIEQRFNKEQLKLLGHPNLTELPLTEPEPK